ncbi:MAG TPA: carboxypeptidase-like regulatory domain-containing protein, partial [Flavisolibacter sp.]|nr:carboxypeptidase-like regulatory domain-containing protein [Flavisolibacter sp.]
MAKITRWGIILLFFISLSKITAAQNATLKGRIKDKSSNTQLRSASIYLQNINYQTISDNEGYYKIENIIPGSYLLTVNYIGFSSVTKTISLKEGQVLELNIELVPDSKSLQEVIIYNKINKEEEAASRTSEKNANNIINVISARAMERSPDINAANVLQRMSGITLQKNSGADESYAVIRGMEPRYNNTLINGAKISSPDEKSRFVSLNIVPSDLLQRIEVSKSLLPEMEGDAIGGTINLILKDAPELRVFKAVASIGYSNIFFDRKFDNFAGNNIQHKSVMERFGTAYAAQPGDFSRSNLDFQKTTALPNGVFGLTFGKRFLKNKLGVLISDNFQNQYYGSNSQFNIVAPDNTNHFKPGITDVANRTSSTRQLNNGVTLHVDFNLNDHNKIIVNNIFLYSYLAQSRLSIDTSITGGNGGRIGPGTGSVFNDNRSLTNHQYLENLKVEGQHILSKHFFFDWAGVLSEATKKSPDRADISIDHKINADYTSTPFYFDNISRIWQHNEDKDYDVLGNLKYRSAI